MAVRPTSLPEKVGSLEAMDTESLMQMLTSREISANIMTKLRTKERSPEQVVSMNAPAQEICSAVPDRYIPFLAAVESHGRLHHYSVYSEHRHVSNLNLVSVTDAVVATH